MKNKSAGFIGIVIFLIALGAAAYFYLQYSSSQEDTSKPSTAIIEYAAIELPNPSQPNVYAGEKYKITWNAIGARKVNIVLMNGTRNYGKQNAEPIDASLGSYEWTAPDALNFFAGLIEGYQIMIEEDRPLGNSAKSQVFNMRRP